MGTNIALASLKIHIHQKPMYYLDLIFELLPENSKQVEKILQLMDELVKEKKIRP